MHPLHFSLLSPSSPCPSTLSLRPASLPSHPLFRSFNFNPSSSASVCASGAGALAPPPAISREPVEANSVAETGENETGGMDKYREVGTISTVHGVKGEVKVVSSTDFPEVRFGKPGKRWLRTRDGGKESIKEIDLIKGRCNPGQNSWIISLRGINSIEEANNIVGSALLIGSDDRPELHEGEFYTPDLVGMRVILKETGMLVGTVVSVMNTKGNDILQVKPNLIGREEEDSSNSQILIPFVEEIVTEVDMERQEMQITPPKGLLELNSRSTVGSSKERRLMEWKQKKKSQQRLATAKKILNDMEQTHVLDALRLAPKAQKTTLAKQIASIDFRLFQHALNNLDKHINGLSEDMEKNFSLLLKNAMKISHENLLGKESERNKFHHEMREKGLDLLSNSKAAIVLMINEKNKIGNSSEIDDDLRNSLSDIGEHLMGSQGRPFVMITATHQVETLQKYLRDNSYFGMDHQKVWVLEEGRLPVFSMTSDQSGSKVLFKSPFELLEAPIGPGGDLSLLSFQKILDAFYQMGIEYLQVCSLDDKSSIGNPLFFGYVSSLDAGVGIKVYNGNVGDGTCFDMIISMKHMNKISRDAKKLGFYAVAEKHRYVEKTSEGWVDVSPEASNLRRLHFPVYGLLNTCSLDDICFMNVLK
ncbi:Ribosome maturation factor RimM [Rhynchospora pubera]|uniref:Ribosome maturation factor RimM n=1 Tax=Rhynchospora pubera TaxID=906938 RepID=A0AAV8FWL8_9POAL|nr:Ribosome maturation factor RimM [Rhynchospora pubera]